MEGERHDFHGCIGPVAHVLYGKPNTALSRGDNLRYGSNGSLSIDLAKDTWFDNEADQGGGVLKLIERETGFRGRDAIAWMRENGVPLDDDQPSAAPPRTNGSHSDAPSSRAQKPRIVATYDYVDEADEFLFQVCRLEGIDDDGKRTKTFLQRRRPQPEDPPDKIKDGWVWSSRGVRQVPYRAPELVEAVGSGSLVFIVEGEKDVDRMRALGAPATCNAGGAGKFPESLIPFFSGADVVIIRDNDPQAKTKDGVLRFHPDGRPVLPGQDHGAEVADKLIGKAKRVRILDIPGLPLKGDASDWIDGGGTIEALYDLVDRHARDWTRGEDFRSSFGAVLFADLDQPGPEAEPLIKGLLTRGETSMLVGPSGSGKSFLATHTGMCIARGLPFLSVRTGTRSAVPRVRKGGVLYIAGEGARGVKKRLRAYRKHFDAPRDVPFVLLTRQLDLHSSDEPTQLLIKEAQHFSDMFVRNHGVKLELIVIDTLSASTPGANENASDDVSRVLARCMRVSESLDAAVMLVHHMNAAGSRERGHSSLRANVDTVIEVAEGEQTDIDNRAVRTAKVTKQKDGEKGGSCSFVLRSVEIGRDEDGDPITSCVVAEPNREAREDDTGAVKIAGANERIILRALVNSLKASGRLPPLSCPAPDGCKVVDVNDWRDECLKKVPSLDAEDSDAKKRDRVRKALERAIAKWQERRLIGFEDPLVWLTGRPIEGFNMVGIAPTKRAEAGAHEPIDPLSDDMLDPL